MDDLFAPPGHDWQRLSPRYRSLVRVSSLITLVILSTIPAVLVGVIGGLWWLSGLLWGVAAVIFAIRWVIADRRWRSWGYVEREDDLYLTHGVLFRTLTAVPYGRMQLVEVNTGPLQRAYGLATVSLVTASAGTDATIPGLVPEEAARLRDRLTELGESQSSGL
ncbi:MAG: PH domain-containing protein [Propionibacteriaceae bacterium]